MPTRTQVYVAIDSERAYQESCIETDPVRHDVSMPDHTVGDYLTMLATYLRKAQDDWTNYGGFDKSLHQIRKIAGIAVHCMEDHGAPMRLCGAHPEGMDQTCVYGPAHTGLKHRSKEGFSWD